MRSGLKTRVLGLLADKSPALQDLLALGPARKVVNPLFGALYHGREKIKWRAVEAMGRLTAHLASTDLESARVIMRRLMWNLNDESGGIGWGSPEAMGETAAASRKLAEEFGCLLVSYINRQGNFLEHPLLQRGSLWGLGRMVNRWPDLAADTAGHLPPFFQDNDPYLKALAAWVALPLKEESLRPLLKSLESDSRQVELFLRGRLQKVSVAQVAKGKLFP